MRHVVLLKINGKNSTKRAKNEVFMTTKSSGFKNLGRLRFRLWPSNRKPTEKSVLVTTLVTHVSSVPLVHAVHRLAIMVDDFLVLMDLLCLDHPFTWLGGYLTVSSQSIGHRYIQAQNLTIILIKLPTNECYTFLKYLKGKLFCKCSIGGKWEILCDIKPQC